MSIKQTRNRGTNKLYANGKLGKLDGEDYIDIRNRIIWLELENELLEVEIKRLNRLIKECQSW